MPDKRVRFKIRRQGTPNEKARWEEFELPWHPGMNVISSMMEIARNPVTRDGKPTTPITYDSNCLEEVCGSCAMLINGKARSEEHTSELQSHVNLVCRLLLEKKKQTI